MSIADKLGDVKDAEGAAAWLPECNGRCVKWESFLKEFTVKDGRKVWTHERLRKARRGLNKLVRDKTLLTFIEMQQAHGGDRPSADNAAESVNARLRDMPRRHRGPPLLRRVKAISWWCCMRTESPDGHATREAFVRAVLHARGKPSDSGSSRPAMSRRCCMHAESPLPAVEIIRVMPADDDVDGLFAAASHGSRRDDGTSENYGFGIIWEKFHMPTDYRQ